jgi:hypothetical protein
VLAFPRKRADETENSKIVRFRSPAGKNDFGGGRVYVFRDSSPRIFEMAACDLAMPVRTRGVTKYLTHSGAHSISNFRGYRRARIVIEIQQSS